MNTWYHHSYGFNPFAFIGFGVLGVTLTLIGIILAILIILLKGYSLWHAARRSEKGWFIALLIVNTFGILELIYLYFIVGKWHKFSSGTPPQTTPTPSSSQTTPTP